MTPRDITLRYLYSLQRRGMKFGLRNIRRLVRGAGNPHRKFPSLHIAGTNGKGSTASFIASMYIAAGYKVGLYTSPHLVRFTERIRVNGKEIPEERLREYVRKLKPFIEEIGATFFEATTCIAFMYFADEAVDVAVVETGLGGRLDSTNVLTPLVSVITSVAKDHAEYLGNSIRQIAREKGGIIKDGVPIVTGSDDLSILKILKEKARSKNSVLWESKDVCGLLSYSLTGGKWAVRFQTDSFGPGSAKLGLAGSHQIKNARLALAAVQLAHQTGNLRVRAEDIRNGLRSVVRNTGIRGRLETIGKRPRFLIDVAHNPDAMRTLVSALPSIVPQRPVVVFGVMKDKEYVEMLKILSPYCRMIVPVSPSIDRALSARKLCLQVKNAGIPFRYGGSVKAGLEVARNVAGSKGFVLITGSHYLAGEAIRYIER